MFLRLMGLVVFPVGKKHLGSMVNDCLDMCFFSAMTYLDLFVVFFNDGTIGFIDITIEKSGLIGVEH